MVGNSSDDVGSDSADFDVVILIIIIIITRHYYQHDDIIITIIIIIISVVLIIKSAVILCRFLILWYLVTLLTATLRYFFTVVLFCLLLCVSRVNKCCVNNVQLHRWSSTASRSRTHRRSKLASFWCSVSTSSAHRRRRPHGGSKTVRSSPAWTWALKVTVLSHGSQWRTPLERLPASTRWSPRTVLDQTLQSSMSLFWVSS